MTFGLLLILKTDNSYTQVCKVAGVLEISLTSEGVWIAAF